MSAAAARRRKQLERKKANAAAGSGTDDPVLDQLNKLLADDDELSETIAYEALQLAQSQVRKRLHSGNPADYKRACELAYTSSLKLLTKGRVSIASQLLVLLVQVLRETHTEVTDSWVNRISELHRLHQKAIKSMIGDDSLTNAKVETKRLQKLEREWLRKCVGWSSELGTIRFGNMSLHELLGDHCWELSLLLEDDDDDAGNSETVEKVEDLEEESHMDLKCDAIMHLTLAEKPSKIIKRLKTLPKPSEEETAIGHSCPPCDRDALLTRSVLCFVAVDNLRDANTFVRDYINKIEERDIKTLTASYVSKEDGKSPSHVVFSSMLLRVCEKDARTQPLYSWLMRSFKKELDMLHKTQVVNSYTTKIGKIYFNIQPPPDMLKTMENMMNMMGGGGMGGMPGGMNPAMMQGLMSQMGGMGGGM